MPLSPYLARLGRRASMHLVSRPKRCAAGCRAQVLQGDPSNHKQALSSYSRGLEEDARRAGGGADAAGVAGRDKVETRRAAWTNIAVLHEHLGNHRDALSAYEQALRQGGSVPKPSEDTAADSDVLLRITDPANSLFWEWKQLPGTASLAKDSRLVETTSSVAGTLRKGTHVRIGEEFVTSVQAPGKDFSFEVAHAPPRGMDAASLEGALFKKVHKIRVTKDIVSVVFNLALLQEKLGHHEAAQELHKAVLAEHPTYVQSACCS